MPLVAHAAEIPHNELLKATAITNGFNTVA
jgi:hypothetical protein